MQLIPKSRRSITSVSVTIWAVVNAILSVQGVTTLLGYPLPPIWVAIIGLTIALVLVWSEMLNLRHKYEFNKTIITVSVSNDMSSGIFGLEVKNDGVDGLFGAQLKILEASRGGLGRMPSTYLGCWKFSRESKSQIFSGHSDLLKVAKYISYSPGCCSMHLDVFYFDTQGSSCASWQTPTHHLVSDWTLHDGTRKPTKPPEYIIEVVISSKPEIKDGIFRKQYKLTFSGLEEVAMAKSQPKECSISRGAFHKLLKKASRPIKKSDKEKP